MYTIGVVLNDLGTFKPDQTTAQLTHALAARGHDVCVIEADGIDVFPEGRLVARGRPARALPTPEDTVAALREAPLERLPLAETDLVLLRTSPGRDRRAGLHELLLQQLQIHTDRGGLVLNDPHGLMVARSKLYLARFPSWTVPHTVVTADMRSARQALADIDGPAVVKPLDGTQGRDVFKIAGPDEPNLSAILANLLAQGPLMVQAFVPQAADGDVRVLLVNGKPVVVDGRAATVRRRPAKGEFRSNVHLGGSAEFAPLTPALRKVVKAVGPQLRRDGLFFVGLDTIGDRIVECNVFSPGGLADASRFADRDFLTPVIDTIEARIAAAVEKKAAGGGGSPA